MPYSIKHGYKRNKRKQGNVALRKELAELVEISPRTCKTINLRHFRLIWLYLIQNLRDHCLDACENVDFLGTELDFWDLQWHRYAVWQLLDIYLLRFLNSLLLKINACCCADRENPGLAWENCYLDWRDDIACTSCKITFYGP